MDIELYDVLQVCITQNNNLKWVDYFPLQSESDIKEAILICNGVISPKGHENHVFRVVRGVGQVIYS